MASCRCQTLIFDSLTKRYRLCKNKKKFYNFCFIHAQIEYNKSAILIQSYFKAFIVRKKLKYFHKLPRDLQCKIIWHMRESIYINCLNNSILKIINKKCNSFFNLFSPNLFGSLDNLLLTSSYTNVFLIICEQFCTKIFNDNYWWQNENLSEINNSLYNEFNSLVRLINKYSLIILSTTNLFTNKNFNYINKFKYIICFIIKYNNKVNQNMKLFNEIPLEYIEFGNLFMINEGKCTLFNWKKNNAFRNGNVSSLWYFSNISENYALEW